MYTGIFIYKSMERELVSVLGRTKLPSLSVILEMKLRNTYN